MSEDKSGYDRGKQNVYNYRLRNDVREAIKDLTLIAQRLPESELESLFNDGTLGPFFDALFMIQTNPKENENWLERKNSKEMKLKRHRLFRLSKRLLKLIGDGRFVSTILPESSKHHIILIGGTEENLVEISKTEALE